MKKIFCLLISTLMIAGVLTSCTDKSTESEKKLSIVTTIFPEYDWVKQILGEKSDNAELTMLLDNGVDLHSYEPTASDIVKIKKCNMFIYTGGNSDDWVDDILAQTDDNKMIVLNLMDVLGDNVREEEIVDGMEHEHDEGHEHAEDKKNEEHEEHEHDDSDAHENDEHIWLSLRNANTICRKIAEKLCEIDPENSDTYTSNMNNYCNELVALDNEYKVTTDNAKIKTLLFADRFPFRYLVDDYGIKYYAAFSGCSAESEAKFETITFLADKINTLGLKFVIKTEGSSDKIADTVISASKSSDVQILTLNSMQTTTVTNAENGADYLNIMKDNLEVLKKSLN